MSRPTTVWNPLTDAIGSEQAGRNAGTERRRSARAALHWTLYLNCSTADHPLRTESRDISKDGFYCLVDQPIRLGELITCDIVVPTHSLQNPDDVVYLRCNALAVRVEMIGDDAGFGVACRIEDYCLIPSTRDGSSRQNTGNTI